MRLYYAFEKNKKKTMQSGALMKLMFSSFYFCQNCILLEYKYRDIFFSI